MFRQDYIKRLIEELGSFAARLAKLIAQNRLDEAEQELQTAERNLGLPVGSERLDPRSQAALIGGGDKVVLAATLLERKAAVLEARGSSSEAEALRQRARALLACARPNELVAEKAALAERLG